MLYLFWVIFYWLVLTASIVVTDAGNRRWSNFRSSCLLVEMGILWNQMLFPLDAHRNFQEIGQLRVKNSCPKFRLARNCSFIWPYTLLISQTKWLKDKSFPPKVFLGHTWLGEIYLLKIFFPMSGNGNNPFYPLLSTWRSTWTEPEALFDLFAKFKFKSTLFS